MDLQFEGQTEYFSVCWKLSKGQSWDEANAGDPSVQPAPAGPPGDGSGDALGPGLGFPLLCPPPHLGPK